MTFKRRTAPESRETRCVVEWAALNRNVHPSLWMLIGVPNAGIRSLREGARLKAEGMRAGVSDLLLLAPSREYHFAAVEMKVGRNKPTRLQIEFLQDVDRFGGIGVVCYSAENAIYFLKWYLGMDDIKVGSIVTPKAS